MVGGEAMGGIVICGLTVGGRVRSITDLKCVVGIHPLMPVEEDGTKNV